MAQRKLHEKIETWIVVSLIAVLVWLYAEAKVLQQHTGTIQVNVQDPTARYKISSPNVQVRVSYKASSGEHQRFKDKTQDPLLIELDTSEYAANDQITLLMKDRLMQAGLEELAITEVLVDPETYLLTVNLLDTFMLPIEVQTQAGISLAGEAEPRPAGILVNAPADLIEQLKGQVATAQLSQDNMGGTEAGRTDTADDLPLRFPVALAEALQENDPWVGVDHRSVDVTYTVADNSARTTLARVPLVVLLTAAQQAVYEVQPAELWLTDVQLVGPSDIIRAIENGDPAYSVQAELDLTSRDLSGINGTTTESPVIRSNAAGIVSDPNPLDGVPLTVRLRNLTP